jgi:hypothetical protein
VLDGTNDYVTWGDLAEADFGTGPFSVGGIFFRLNAIDKAQTLICKYDAVNKIGWELVVTSSNHLMGYVGLGTAKYDFALFDAELVTDVWYCAAMTYSGTVDRTLTLYCNAVVDDLYAVSSGISPSSPSNTVELRLGAAA